MQTIWKQLYSHNSHLDKGSLFQLKTTCQRSNVPADPTRNMNATEAFLGDTLVAYIVAAAEEVLGGGLSLLSSDSMPSSFTTVAQLAGAIVRKYVDLECQTAGPCSTLDEVYQYSREVITMFLLWRDYHDAVKEGDGARVICIWRFLMVVFKMGGRKNYALEAVQLLMQYEYLLSPRLKAQLTWSRFVNMHGRARRNIPCDLQMEHMNR